MTSPMSNNGQGHLTLTLPMKSPADGQALRKKVPGVMPAFSKAADAVGTLHYFRADCRRCDEVPPHRRV